MFITHIRHKNIGWPQAHRMFHSIKAVFHLNRAIEYDENLRPIIDVPDIGRVGPRQPHRGAFNFYEAAGAPGAWIRCWPVGKMRALMAAGEA